MLDFLLIFIIAVPRATTKLDDVWIFKASTKVFGMLFNDGFALNRFLGRKGGAFREAYLGAVLFGFSDALRYTAM